MVEGGATVANAVTAAAGELPSRMYEPTIATDADARTLADHGVFNVDESGDGYAAVLRDALQRLPIASAIN